MKKLSNIFCMLLFALSANAQTINDTIVVYANCEHCIERIEGVLKPTAGILSARMDVSVGKLFVSYNSQTISNNQIQKMVANIGHDTKNYRAADNIYKALPACCKYERAPLIGKQVKYQTANLLITGMTCAEGCAKGIELKIYQQNGVKFSEVNYEKQKAKIVFDPTKISLQKIIQLIVDFKPENGEINKYEVTVLP
jgi:copper chaperone CopZ